MCFAPRDCKQCLFLLFLLLNHAIALMVGPYANNSIGVVKMHISAKGVLFKMGWHPFQTVSLLADYLTH